ncbi:MAG TPA: glycosyltransferase [Casimicrobiaceae bacterium]|nr:glycosyltransferase [Casimicrobiaceae bacterium]
MPQISVIVASKVGAPFVDQCLASIRAEVEGLDAETIVVAAGDRDYAERLAGGYRWARVIHAPELRKVPALRRRGVEEASGDFVAIIEEHCSAGEGWLRKAVAAHARGMYAAVGGPVADFDYDRLPDWAVYFMEYNSALPPWTAGETAQLQDVNIMYRREALTAHLDLLGEGYWPMTLHPTLLAEGARFLSVPDMLVHHRGPFAFAYYLRQRYLFSRAFAGVRARGQSAARRWAYLLGGPVVPFFLLARMGASVVRKRCRVGKFLRALPLLGPALVVLVAGEWVGCLLGPGDALSDVE